MRVGYVLFSLLLIACGGATAAVTDGGGSDGGSSAPPGTGTDSCTIDRDCSLDGSKVCAFRESDHCDAKGTCVTPSQTGPCSNHPTYVCACDHTNLDTCDNLPAGFFSKPVAARGECPHSYPAQPPCATSRDCPSGWQCGFSVAEACGAKGTCWDTRNKDLCDAYSPGCACDGTEINLVCLPFPQGIVEKPLAHEGPCVDAGP